MKIHIVTIGKPKLLYAKEGMEEYLGRLKHMHSVRLTQLADKYAYDSEKLLAITAGSYVVCLEIEGTQLSSPGLAEFLNNRALEASEVSFVIGGPEGLPSRAKSQADYLWSLGKLTLPHDLAMVVTAEALYRASTINARLPYHK